MGKLTISMAMFNSKLFVYRRVETCHLMRSLQQCLITKRIASPESVGKEWCRFSSILEELTSKVDCTEQN